MISKIRISLIAMLIPLVVAVSNSGCGSGTSSTLLPSVSVSVSAGTLTMRAGATMQITATVNNDSANKGVTWSVSCSAPPCGKVSPTTTPSGTATTYTAPTPDSSFRVTITATSLADPSKLRSASVNILGIGVSIVSSNATAPMGTTAQLAATVTNDGTNSGITWSVSCPVPQCGRVSPTSTPSGTPTTYTAPSTTRPSGLTVDITATVVINGARTGVTITVPGPSLLVIPTYDGSGQAVEPKVLYFPTGWHGFSYWMAMTPYPYSDAFKENPSILVSSDGQTWQVPPGLVNPVAPIAGFHLADPELFYDASSDELWLYYLEEDLVGNTLLLLRTSSDGILWSSPSQLSSNKNYQMDSPTVAKNGSQYLLWGINSGSVGCAAQSTEVFLEDSPDGRVWSPPQTLQISQPGFVIWHISVIWVQAKQEFWALYAAYPGGDNCGHTSLFFARSPDGIHWVTYSKPVFVPGDGWDSRSIYRSTLVYQPDVDLLQVWFSTQGDNNVWSIGFTEFSYGDFANLLQ